MQFDEAFHVFEFARVKHLVFDFFCVIVPDAHLVWSDLEAPVSSGEGLAEAEECEKVEVSDRPLKPLSLSLYREVEVKGIVEDLAVDKREHWQVFA
jgi:hypothetical protein